MPGCILISTCSTFLEHEWSQVSLEPRSPFKLLGCYVVGPKKDAFQEAKANGFSVTVIKKGQLQLNIDQTLEEVEESITDIGSKIYHDAIMREQSLDVSTVMKGLFGTGKPTKKRRRSRKKLKKPTSR